jgi:hypothetical protein
VGRATTYLDKPHITGHQAHANQNHKEKPLHTPQDGYYPQTENNNCCAVGGLMQLPWETVWQFLKQLNTELSHGPAMPLLGIY